MATAFQSALNCTTAVQGASPSLLWPNLIDALYALLRAFSEPQHQGVSRQWVFGALRDDQVCATLGEEVRKEERENEIRREEGQEGVCVCVWTVVCVVSVAVNLFFPCCGVRELLLWVASMWSYFKQTPYGSSLLELLCKRLVRTPDSGHLIGESGILPPSGVDTEG